MSTKQTETIVRQDSTTNELEKLTRSCTQCGHCCRFGSGFLIESDIRPMADYLSVSVDELKKQYLEEATLLTHTVYRPKLIKQKGKAYGTCVFLKDSRCSIYSVRPLYCRIGTGCMNHADRIWQWFLYHHVAKHSKTAWDEFQCLHKDWKEAGKDVLLTDTALQEHPTTDLDELHKRPSE